MLHLILLFCLIIFWIQRHWNDRNHWSNRSLRIHVILWFHFIYSIFAKNILLTNCFQNKFERFQFFVFYSIGRIINFLQIAKLLTNAFIILAWYWYTIIVEILIIFIVWLLVIYFDGLLWNFLLSIFNTSSYNARKKLCCLNSICSLLLILSHFSFYKRQFTKIK